MHLLLALLHGLAIGLLIALPYAGFVWLLDWFYRWLARPTEEETPVRVQAIEAGIAVAVLLVLWGSARAWLVWWVHHGRRMG